MNNFLVKLFYPRKYIRCLVAMPDHAIRAYNVVPKGQAVVCGSREFLLTDDSPWMKTGRNVPCYLFAHNRTKPLDVYAENGVDSIRRDSEKSPEDLKAFVDSNAFQRMARKRSGKDIIVYMLIGAVIMIGGFYYLYTQIQAQTALIAELKLLLETIGG